MTNAHFVYVPECELKRFVQERDFVAWIPEGMRTGRELFEILDRELQLPAYFGFNWNALWDCIRDLSWIDSKRIILVHKAVPELEQEELRIYLQLISDAVEHAKSSKAEENHELVVIFPPEARQEIEKVLKK